jgi:DNA repair exonuclease SbcCD ATPase subunit
MTRRFLLAGLGLVALTGVLMLRAAEPTTPVTGAKPNDPQEANKLKEDLLLREQILGRQFLEFEQKLLKLKQRLEKSGRQEDRDRAVIIQQALDKIRDTSISTRFEQLSDLFRNKKLNNLPDIQVMQQRSQELADDLRAIIAMLREDSRANKLREERMRVEKMVEELKQLIRREKTVQGQTHAGKTERKELQNAQNQVARDTDKLNKAIGPNKGQGAEAKDTKAGAKGEGKGDGKKGEGKDAGKSGDPKSGEAKDAGKGGEAKQGEAKAGEGKQGEGKEGKTGEAKDGGDKKGGEAKEGEAKAGEQKAGQAGAKPGDPKQGQQGEAKGSKAGQGSKAGSKAGGEKKAGGQAGKPGEAKASKGGEGSKAGSKANPSASKSGQSQSKSGGHGQPKQGEAKSGKSAGQGQSKGQSRQTPAPYGTKPSEAKGDPGAQKAPPPKPQQPQQDATSKAQKRIQEAIENMRKAEEKIQEAKNPEATQDQDDAIKNLEAAKKRLEDLLRQLREEELERLLANLQQRCEKMLAMQIRVYDGTVAVQKTIDGNANKKANRTNEQDSLKLSDDEKAIVSEASKAIQMLEDEGSAVAFPEVFVQVRDDMRNVQRRLGVVDTGKITQATEEDIINTLKEMIEALKKAQKDIKSPPKPPGPSGPPPDPKLLDEIAELKMIRSMQIRVNTRTQLYGRQYNGEQAEDPNLRREILQLSDRQERIYDVTNRIVRGENK